MNSYIERFAMMTMLATGAIAVLGADGCSTTSAAPAGGACGADPSVTGCAAGDGYSCPAGAAPDAALTCSVGVSAANGSGDTLYCCYTAVVFPASTCSPNPSLDAACPDPSSFGYSCAPGDNPMTYDATLLCSVDSAGTGDFCCTTSAGGG